MDTSTTRTGQWVALLGGGLCVLLALQAGTESYAVGEWTFKWKRITYRGLPAAVAILGLGAVGFGLAVSSLRRLSLSPGVILQRPRFNFRWLLKPQPLPQRPQGWLCRATNLLLFAGIGFSAAWGVRGLIKEVPDSGFNFLMAALYGFSAYRLRHLPYVSWWPILIPVVVSLALTLMSWAMGSPYPLWLIINLALLVLIPVYSRAARTGSAGGA